MVAKPAKGKGGRPPKSEEGALTRTLAFRLRPSLHEKLQAAALQEGRSLSEEVEARVTRSFTEEEIQQKRFGDPAVSFLANLVASTVSLIQIKTGRSCTSDPETYEAAKNAVAEIFDCSMSLFKDVSNVPAMQRRFDRMEFDRLTSRMIDDAASASISFQDILER